MTILDEINNHKRREIEEAKAKISIQQLMLSSYFKRKTNSLKAALLKEGASGIIAEFKTKSPSKGVINADAEVSETTAGYVAAGVSGISVLTDSRYFGGSLENLAKARQANPNTPILRKDFMLDPYQIYEAKAHGADLILLIAESLSKELLLELTLKAKELGLEVLVEIHSEEELAKLNPYVDIVGVNNRDLRTFVVDVETSVRLSKLIPEQFVKISESGISNPKNIAKLSDAGFKGYLIGETFMKTADPAKACAEFINSLK
ncbi:MAG: indole-3-glycerol phosphate synthase [Bacteroidetes bacterium GWF2_42_66]|nr:MAG: indole-3-glycerol phosphate synthase [Bacteroidetes bacterium GWA2_42_15]OFX99237.1 MAG: indole-3-glycerol phosphate synthase [Bacteroidetes bacterium GWE2_42_39]OFY40633.1 MAG: indole-3-glycerol phosphate synthase [Bacteroidetes bacterium GWF2_42_66]HBL76583.1 indole-3-glycerol phosphate synthase TrpC [Prolixibacteraceae bacterium]HCR88961.1 indole-3-glycerol phosphate synthase TrpC [Prolixibacteraceae bacterium]